MNKIKILMPLALSLMLAACATSRPTMSYVAKEITSADAATLAADAVTHLAGPLPPAHTTLVLDAPSPTAGQADMLTPVMVEKLRERGYGVTQADAKEGPKKEQGTMLRYLASPMDNGVVLRLQYLQREASRFYPRSSDGALMPGAPFAVRDGGGANEQ